jgi:hypothetical protein
VVNEELTQRVSATWWYAVAVSYRRQNEYRHEPPFEEAPPTRELRPYARVSHVLTRGPLKLTHTFRPEARSFFAAHAASGDTLLQLRLRLPTQLTWSLDREQTNRIVASAELLGAVSRTHAAQRDRFDYRESRFCLYYSRRLSRAPVSIDIGYMNNLLGKGSPRSVHYLAIDVVWENPFGSRRVSGT